MSAAGRCCRSRSAIFVAASIGCALAPSVDMLIVLRGVQAFGVAAAPVLARAIVRDLYSGARAGRELSRMGTIMALAPAIAPSLGGLRADAHGVAGQFLPDGRIRPLCVRDGDVAAAGDPGAAGPRNDVAVIRFCAATENSCGTAASCRIWRSCPQATADCSPGFRDPRSRCRRFTASRRSRSGSPSQASTLGFLCGTLIAAKLVSRYRN